MKPSIRSSSEKALTMLEVLVVIGIIVMLAFLCLPALSSAKANAPRFKCVSNLKQVGLGFRIFAGDNNEKYPFEATNGFAFNDASNAWMHFQAMSNELASAKILMCPSEVRQRYYKGASDFSNTSAGLMWPSNQDLSLSYFVGLGADEARPQSILSGDRNMAKPGYSVVYSSFAHGGANQVFTNSVWLPGLLHGVYGIVVMGDASVKQITSKQLGEQLRAAVDAYGNTNNYFLFPQ